MASATIGVSNDTKRSLAAAKPAGMPWDAFMAGLLEAADTDRFFSIVDDKRGGAREAAVEQAKQRYMKYRRTPGALLTGAELRRRIHVRRLLESLGRFHGGLRIASAGEGDPRDLRRLLEDLDTQVHEARDLLAA